MKAFQDSLFETETGICKPLGSNQLMVLCLELKCPQQAGIHVYDREGYGADFSVVSLGSNRIRGIGLTPQTPYAQLAM